MRSSISSQWVVALLDFSKPALANRNAPVHTDAVMSAVFEVFKIHDEILFFFNSSVTIPPGIINRLISGWSEILCLGII